ncbi:MAG: winged helix-turn-helix domain-containing protein [Pseudomonadota bacterium]
MYDGPNIVPIAALIGDEARAAMLTALMGGEALTATELATEANITKQTASALLSKLREAGLIQVASQGRHRYFQLANKDVAQLLENLMGIAERTGNRRVRPGPNDPELRHARVCYDHLAGDVGVELFDSLLSRRLIRTRDHHTDIQLTQAGEKFFQAVGIPIQKPANSRRPLCKACLDWSVRRHHLAGVAGASILNYCLEQKWAKRMEGTRVITFSAKGEQNFQQQLLN